MERAGNPGAGRAVAPTLAAVVSLYRLVASTTGGMPGTVAMPAGRAACVAAEAGVDGAVAGCA